MRIDKLQVHNFRGFSDTEIVLNGKDAIFNYKGKRFTQRGDATNNDAIVWQLVADNGKDIFNFLREDEKTLTLLNDKFENIETGLKYSLKSVE